MKKNILIYIIFSFFFINFIESRESDMKENAQFLTPRPSRIYPIASQPPTHLYVFDAINEVNMTEDEKYLAVSIQGLFNAIPQSQSKIMILWQKEDEWWLNWLYNQKYVNSKSILHSLKEMLELIDTRQTVVYNAEPSHLPNIALMVASCEKCLLVKNPELLKQFDLKVKIDLRNRFKTNIEAYDWILEQYGNQLSRQAVAIYDPVRSPVLRDYLIANRIFTFWISGSKDGNLSGANSKSEEEYFKKILAYRFPVNIPVLGYPWAGDGVGIGEGDGVRLLSQCGKFLVPSDLISNLSVLSTFPNQNSKPLPNKIAQHHLEKNKHYVSFLISDGDNLCTWANFFPSYWEKLGPHNFPVSWTMGSSIIDLIPPVYDYCYKNLPEGDTIGGAVSGIGYISMESYGKAFPDNDRKKVIDEFIALTSEYAQKLGQKWLWIMNYGSYNSEELKYYDNLKGIEVLMGGYGRSVKEIDKAVEVRGDKIVFHTLNKGGGVEAYIKQIDDFIQQSNSPLFLHWFISNWNVSPTDLLKLAEAFKQRNIEIVTPEELAALYREYLDKKKE